MNTKILIVLIVIVVLGIGGFFIYKKVSQPSYSYALAEFVQKQQTFSPYTKYEPSFAVNKKQGEIYYVFKAMDDNDIWQIWTAVSDLDGNNWQETQQTNSQENKQRPVIIYDPQDNLTYYFYRTGNELGAAQRVARRLVMAVKSPDEEKWRSERELIGNDGVDDTVVAALDSARRNIILAYTKNQQITTGLLNLDKGTFKETVHTNTPAMNFIPNMVYDEPNDAVYLVFPRARTPHTFDNKDLWFATLKGDGSGYQEKRLTETDYDNTWPFITLDSAGKKIYVSYSFFKAKPTYSQEGIPQVREEGGLGRMNFDGSGWEKMGKTLKIFGTDDETGVLYGIYQESKKDLSKNEKAVRYFVAYDPQKNETEKQFIPSGDEQTYYDAAFRKFDNETRRLFASQQVCRFEGNQGIVCQVWTYTGRVLREGEKSFLPVQTEAEMAPAQFRQLPEFKIISVEAVGDKVKINTNRKLSMPVEFKVIQNGQEIRWEPRQLNQVDQDRGIELRFDNPLSSYEVSYKVCALSDPENPECKEGTASYSGGQSGPSQISAPGVFEGQDFKITIPEGWTRASQIQGTLVTIAKINESFSDEPDAQAINFKSYIVVVSDKTNGKSISQTGEEFKNEVLNSIPDSKVVNSSDETVNNMPAKFYEMAVPQQGVNFEVLMAIVAKGDKVFVISFNTTDGKWPIYKDIFYRMARSFEFKY